MPGGGISAGMLLLTGAVLGLAMAGCGGKGPQRHRISGLITFRGQPVPEGHIAFDPPDEAGIGGGFAFIRDGRYDTSEAGRGHLGGPHLVRISGTSGQPLRANNPESGSAPLFPTYEVSIDLPRRAESRDFEVPINE